MPKYEILGERTLVTAWTYIVTADDYETAIEMVEECPDGECENIIRRQDDNCYEDTIEFSFLSEIEEPKKAAKKAVPKKNKTKK